MDQKMFAEIVAKAEGDAKFLHQLTFQPEKVLAELSGKVDRQVLGGLVAKHPAEVVARTIGIDSYCGNTCTSSCDNTCGGSCGYTTNLVDHMRVAVQRPYFSRGLGELAACGNTCTSSCDNTCGGSCGYTTNLVDHGQMVSRFSQSFR